jgi:hypothetical protein
MPRTRLRAGPRARRRLRSPWRPSGGATGRARACRWPRGRAGGDGAGIGAAAATAATTTRWRPAGGSATTRRCGRPAALADAAALRADAVRAPFTLSAQVDLRRLTVDPATDPLPPPFDDLFAVDAATDAVTLQLVLRPFLVGDLADLGDQRGLEVERGALQAASRGPGSRRRRCGRPRRMAGRPRRQLAEEGLA